MLFANQFWNWTHLSWVDSCMYSFEFKLTCGLAQVELVLEIGRIQSEKKLGNIKQFLKVMMWISKFLKHD